MEKIILGKQYTLDMGQHITVIPRRVLTEGIECDYVMSSPGRKELITFDIWKMNGFDVSDYSLMWMDVEFDTGRTKPEPKFKVGNKVLVCDELKTEIINVEYKDGEWRYYFKDENNNIKSENEAAIERIGSFEVAGAPDMTLDQYFEQRINEVKGIDVQEALMDKLREQCPSQKEVIEEILTKRNVTINTSQADINATNESVDDINFNVESEAIRLTSTHYKQQRGNWSWLYGDEVDKDSWEMAKEHASFTAEENIKQAVINKLDNKIIDFWFDVIRKIKKL